MSNDPTERSRSTEGMVDYDEHSSAQQAMVLTQRQRLDDLIGRLGRVEPEMRIVDYGCGPGTSAITSVKPSVESYRARFGDGAVVVCHADQPGNDWTGLFDLAFGPSGYRSDRDGVRTEAAVGSFYDQLVGDDCVSLGTCFAASHWLRSPRSVDAPGTVWFADLVGDSRRHYAEWARQDWVRFLTMRARELRSGGFLVVATLGSIPDPDETNGVAAAGRGIYRALQVVAQSMADDGLLDGDVLNHFVFPLWFMTEREALAPLEEDDALADAFDIESIEVAPAPHNPSDFFADLRHDPDTYAEAYTGYIRAFADSTLRTHLFEPSAGDGGRHDELADEFYRRLGALYRSRLDEFAFELWQLAVVVRRRQRAG